MREFTAYLQNKDLSKATQKAYLLSIVKFLDWYGSELQNCTQKDILNYLEHLKEQKKQANITRKYNLYALQHYFNFLYQNDLTATNPTAFIKIRGGKTHKLQKIYTSQQLEQLYDNYYNVFIRNFDYTNIPKNQQKQTALSRERNYTVLGLLVYQGLVTSEFDRLKVSDIDFVKATIKVQGRTKATDRTLPLHATQIGVLMNYIQNIRPLFFEFCRENEQLFLPLPTISKRFTASHSVEGIFKPLTRQLKELEADLKKIQQIRASRITHWLKTEGLRKTQYLAGHKSIASTEAYLPNDLEQLTDDLIRFNPF